MFRIIKNFNWIILSSFLCIFMGIVTFLTFINEGFVPLTDENLQALLIIDIILLLILLFSFSFVMSFYHFGIEQSFFEESAICSLKNSFEIISKEEILKQLQATSISCKDVTFKIFGFSLTTINMLISLILVILLINMFKNYAKLKK